MLETNLIKLIYSFLDLDDTLYPLSSGLAASVLKNIQGKRCRLSLHIITIVVKFLLEYLTYYAYSYFCSDYMIEKLGIEESKIPDLCNLLYKNYGTTMAGLRVSSSAPFKL